MKGHERCTLLMFNNTVSLNSDQFISHYTCALLEELCSDGPQQVTSIIVYFTSSDLTLLESPETISNFDYCLI